MAYSPGEIIMRNRPWVYVLEEKSAAIYCHFCFRRPIDSSDAPLKRCTGCYFAHYCNATCAKAAWKDHKLECKKLKLAKDEQRDIPECNIRLLARVIGKVLRKELSDPPEACEPRSSRTYDDLCTHADQVERSAIQLTAFSYTINNLVAFIGKENMLQDKPSLLNAYSKVHVNSMTLYDGARPYGIGAALPLGATRFDHACKPNADYMIRNSNGCEIVIRALEKIDRVEDVRICYCNSMDMTPQRRAIIQEHYYFQCQCDFCLDEHRDNMMRSVHCPNEECSGALPLTTEFLPTNCTKCEKIPNDGNKYVRKAALLMAKTNEEVTNYSAMFEAADSSPENVKKQSLAFRKLRVLFDEVESVLFPLNIFYVKLIVHLAENESEFGRRLYLQETDAYRYYHGLSAFLGIRLVLQGGQQVAAQQFDEATKSLEEAERILTITHGTDHPVYKDMMNVKTQQIPQLRKMTKRVQNLSTSKK